MTRYLAARLRGNPAFLLLVLALAGGIYAAAAYAAKPPPQPRPRPAVTKNPPIRVQGPAGLRGATRPAGLAGAAEPAGSTSAAVQLRTFSTGTVTAPHGASTSVPLSGASWTQAAGDLDLVVGSVTLQIPSACTGSFGNALVINVDGKAATFGLAPTTPASSSVTMPISVAGIMEQTASTSHTITAALANSCTKSGEDFTVNNVKLDVLKFN
jgi:hypothetical protein